MVSLLWRFILLCCSVQFSCSVVSDSATQRNAAGQAFLSITNFWSLLTFMPIESVMTSNHLILCQLLLLLPSIFPSIRVFSNEWTLHIRWPKCWSFSISPSSEFSALISFRIDWFDLLAVLGTLKSLLQHRSLKASILWPSTFFNQKVDVPLKKVTDGIKLSFPSESKLFLVILLIA